MLEIEPADDFLLYGDISPKINALLQQGIAAHRADPSRARTLFGSAIELAPETLPAYRCLFKLLNKLRDFDSALATARAGLAEAARQAGLDPDWQSWQPGNLGEASTVPQRFVLQFLKALAYIYLRRGEDDQSRDVLAQLQRLDPEDGVGGSVIAALLGEDQG
jgi:tetratricopeptide (TPR) repeat protein